MKQIRTYSDTRLDGMCCYCGDYPDTRDHVPSKILLDAPFPENLPVVPCCDKCNQGFSKDEQYLACLLECAVHGTTDLDKLKRPSIVKTLKENAKLHKLLTNAREVAGESVAFQSDLGRVKNVILKLAKGHAKFENSEPQLEEPSYFVVKPMSLTTDEELNKFLSTEESVKWPEVGSRAMLKLTKEGIPTSRWIVVQENQYMYQVAVGLPGPIVKLVIQNYLLAEVRWD